ncbi:MAG TPA: AarF/UbiB family protein, partial [Ilumatobacteraceae bacterium]|nr:AarF/UbiB family protein [Ilumatobacteraceae bacterium]
MVALATALATVAVKVRQASAESPLTNGFSRTVRVWRLSTRNGARFAAMKVRRIASPADRRAELDEQFAIRTAEDVAKHLGEMKGVLMKAGQLISFIFEALPDEAQEALATLQADAAPMSPSLAASVVQSELGAPPERVFLEWGDMPVAAASIGQVHRAVTPDGRDVAVKVQYPGVREAIE